MNVTGVKNKASANVKTKMNVTVGKNKASGKAKAQAKVVRKPLGDLTNTLRPRALEKPSKKKSVDNNVSLVSHPKGEDYAWVKEEGFLHDHDKCVECANSHSNASYATMIMDLFAECTPLTARPMELVEFTPVKFDEFQTPLRLDLFAECSPTRWKKRGSPCWSVNDSDWIIDWDSISAFKLKEDV